MNRLLSSFALFISVLAGLAGRSEASTVQLSPASYEVREDAGSVSVTVTVTRGSNPNEVIQVDYTTMDATALAPGDYTASSGTLTFTAGTFARTVVIPINAVDDADDNDAGNATGSENFSFKISNPRSNGGAQPTINGSDTATVTILDTNGNRIGFTSPDYQVSEPPAGDVRTVRLVVKRAGSNSQPATITYQTNDGTAHAGTDYFSQSGTVNFPNNSPDKAGEDAATQFIDITVLSDEAAAGNKNFTVTLNGNYGGSRAGTSTATVTIIDSQTSTVQFSAASYTVSETGTKASITLVRSGNLSIGGTVNVATSAGSAQPVKNYTTTTQTISFSPGESAKTFDVPLINDNAVTGTLYFDISLSLASGSPLLIGGIVTTRVFITDAAPSTTVEFIQAEYAVSQDAGLAKITVRLNRAPDSNDIVGVDYSTATFTGSGQAAVANQDYTPVSGRLTFNPGETIKIFQVPIIDNGQVSNTKKVALNLSNPSGNAFLGVSSATLNIENTHTAGAIQFSTAQYSVLENNGSVTLTVLLNRTGDTSRAVTVDYATNPGSAGTERFTPASGRLTFAAGSAVATISVAVLNDTIIQPPQTFSVSLTNPQNAVLGSITTATVTIQDDDGLNTVEFDASDYGAVETDGVALVKIRAVRGGDPNQVLTVDITFGAEGDSAFNGSDYSGNTQTITFPAGVSVQTVAIPINNNDAAQPARFFTVNLENPGTFTQIGRQSSARVTIFDRSGPNTVQLLTSVNRFREGDQQAIAITVVRFGDFSVTGTRVNYTTEIRQGDTAQAGVNFTQTSGQIEFTRLVQSQNGQNVVVGNETQKSIIIPIPNNTLVQGDVTFHVTLTSSDVAQLGSISTTQVTITDDDLGNTVQFSSATYSVGEGSGNAILTVKLLPNGDASKATSVNFAATPITAFSGFDFSPVSGTLIFAPGETSKTILIPINNDSLSENTETFRVTLSSPGPGAIIGDPSNAIVTIIDDDVSSSIQFSPANYTVSETAGTVTLTVIANRQGNPSNVLTVQYQTFGGTATENADYAGTAGMLTFGAGETQKTITIQILDDNLIESTENFSVVLSNPSSGASLGSVSTATVDIADNDSPTAAIGFAATSFDVDEGAPFANLLVTRSGGLGVIATVNYATSDGTAKAGVNYQASSGSITFGVNEVSKVIQIPIIDDATVNPTLSFTVTLTSANGTGFVGGQSTATVNIIDNDATSFRFNPTEYTVNEGAGTVTLTVEALRIGNASDVISVDYVTANGTALADVRYTRTSGRLTFNAGVTKQTITVPIIDGTAKEGTQFFFVNLSNPLAPATSAQPRIGSGKATVTIFDNDATTFQFSSPTYTVNNSSGAATITVTLSRLSNPDGIFTVDYFTSDITAQAGIDYTPTSGRLTFGSGETAKTISVAVTPQSAGQPTRQFQITLANPSAGAELGQTSTAVVSITNFDFSTKLLNVSTRAPVEQGDGVMIAGFIVQDSGSKQVIIRALGPSLTGFGVVNAIQDPTLQLMDANGNQVAFNDDYLTNTATDRQIISDNGLTPTDTREAVLVATVPAGGYTAILRGKTNGVGLVEVFDASATSTGQLANISTRSRVLQGDSGALIAGFIVAAPSNQPGTAQKVVIRALGASLKSLGVSDALADPTLEIYRGSLKILENDNWKTQTSPGAGSKSDIEATGLKPSNDKEAAILTSLDPGAYTAVVRGKSNTTGTSLVEVFRMAP